MNYLLKFGTMDIKVTLTCNSRIAERLFKTYCSLKYLVSLIARGFSPFNSNITNDTFLYITYNIYYRNMTTLMLSSKSLLHVPSEFTCSVLHMKKQIFELIFIKITRNLEFEITCPPCDVEYSCIPIYKHKDNLIT